MGANLSTFKRSSSSSAATQRLQQAGGGYDNSSPAGPSYMELLKPECLKVKAEKKKRKIHNNIGGGGAGSGTRLATLEDWLLASPGHQGMTKPGNYNIIGGELYVFRPDSRKVHPASSSSASKLPADHEHTAAAAPLASKAKDSFCLERLVTNAEHEANLANYISTSVSCRSQSGNHNKLKKKVSFRLPEEADIIVFYPSEVTDSDINDEDYV